MTNKYNNTKREYEGEIFDSLKELKRYKELRILENQGKIRSLERQKKYILIPAQYEPTIEVYKSGPRKGEIKRGKLIERECSYFADFTYFDCETRKFTVEDVKGYRGATGAYNVFVIKRKLMLEKYGIRVKEV